MTRLLVFLLLFCRLGAQPVAMTLHAEKPVWVAGEGVRLRLHVRAEADGELESIELNRSATRIHLRSVTGTATVLTGADHLRLFPEKVMAGVGTSFHVRAKQEWDAELDLLQYALPLPAGRYTAEVEYRGARSGLAAFEVAPAVLGPARWRLYGGTELAGVYAANGKWFHTARTVRDPRVVLFTAEIGNAVPAVTELPRLAYFPANAGTHAERLVVWTEGSRFCWLAVTGSGPAGSRQCADSRLPGRVQLAEPALQTLAGELRAVLFSARTAVEIRVPMGGAAIKRNVAEGRDIKGVAVSWEPEPALLLMDGSNLFRARFDGERTRLRSMMGTWTGFETEEWNGVSTIVASTRSSSVRWRNDESALESLPAGFRLWRWRVTGSAGTGYAIAGTP